MLTFWTPALFIVCMKSAKEQSQRRKRELNKISLSIIYWKLKHIIIKPQVEMFYSAIYFKVYYANTLHFY